MRHWRMKRGLTQAALAEAAELDLRFIQRVERARTNPGVLALIQIALALGVAPGAMFRQARVTEAKPGRPRKRVLRPARSA